MVFTILQAIGYLYNTPKNFFLLFIFNQTVYGLSIQKKVHIVPIIKSIRQTVLIPIHPAGYPFIGISLATTALLYYLLGPYPMFIGFLISLWCIYFFRNPVRYTPQHQSLIISPADGRILSITEGMPPKKLGLIGADFTKISIFMNIFDVHVNRSPMEGQVVKKSYFPGSFFDASLDKASEKNEQLSITMNTIYGKKIAFVQIAGLVARRILCNVSQGSELKCGQQFGIIRFGSRVDLWLPNPIFTKVLVGQRTYAGETILADFEPGAKLNEARIE